MVALQHADLGDVGEAERAVGRGVVELRRVEQAAVDGRDDLAAGERVHGSAHGSEQVDRDADGAVFQTLEVVDALHRLLEPAERLRVERRIRERHDVGADGRKDLFKERLAAAVLVPGEQHVGVHRVARPRAPQRQRGVLAVVIDEHAVAAVEHALRHRVEQAECRHHGAGRKHLDLEVAAGHVVDPLAEVERVFVEDVLRRPRALEAHADRPLRLDDARCRDGCRAGRERAGLQELAACNIGCCFITHRFLLLDYASGAYWFGWYTTVTAQREMGTSGASTAASASRPSREAGAASHWDRAQKPT